MTTGAAVSGVPTVSGTPTSNSITVNVVTIPNNPGGQSVQYAISTSTTTPTSGWQDGRTFSPLPANTQHFVFARSAANANANVGTAQRSAGILTAQTITLTSNIRSAEVNVLAGVNGRVPITVTAPVGRSITIVGTAGSSNDNDPALYNGQGATATRIAFQNHPTDQWNFTFSIPAGQTQTIFAGTGGNVARSYTITSTGW
jgi:hypothetical protein